MAVANTIQFTPEQARSLTGVSAESLRHWKRAVPYLAARSGKASRFTLADLIGLAAIQELKERFGVSVVAAGGGVEALFSRLAEARLPELATAVALLTETEASLVRPEEVGSRRLTGATLVLPCGPIFERICATMVPGYEPGRQHALPFPPRAVRASA